MKKNGKRAEIYYPFFLNLSGKKCLVIGGGQVALRKVTSILECGAKATVISPVFLPEFKKLTRKKNVTLIQRNVKPEDLKGAEIVFSATDSRETNRKIAERAKKQNALVNVVDDPDHSDFIVPSFFRRGELTIAVSTGGSSPAFAKKVRSRLERTIGEDYSQLLSIMKGIRSELKQKGTKVSSESWQESLDLDFFFKLLESGQAKKVKKILLEGLRKAKDR
jgi:precorrin-2 dehydrogenase / sirohydrochlorin ferrochelatase